MQQTVKDQLFSDSLYQLYSTGSACMALNPIDDDSEDIDVSFV